MKNKDWEFGQSDLELLILLKNEALMLAAKEKGARNALNTFLENMVKEFFYNAKIFPGVLFEVNFSTGAERFIFESVKVSYFGECNVSCYPILKSGKQGKCLESYQLIKFENIKNGVLPKYIYRVENSPKVSAK